MDKGRESQKERGTGGVDALLRRLPQSVAVELSAFRPFLWQQAEEIRFRLHQPALLISAGREYEVPGQTVGFIEKNTLNNIINKLLNYSDYAYPQELSSGYIAVPGGHRAGFCGQVVMEEGKVATIRDVTSINLRIARDIPDVATGIWPQLLEGGSFRHTLIASPPGCGKTTLLRGLIRRLSDEGYNVSVCDERNEISGASNGSFAFDLGVHTDVMASCPKASGMVMMLRSMGPEVIATDEIGTADDVDALRRCIASGVTLLTTVHAADLQDLLRSPLRPLIASQVFSRIVFLGRRPHRGTISAIWKRENVCKSE